MELITKPLSISQISQIVENDEICFKVAVSKRLYNSYKRAVSEDNEDNDKYFEMVEKLHNKISNLVLGSDAGMVICFKEVKDEECDKNTVILSGRMNVADFLFGGNSCSDYIRDIEIDCEANMTYSQNSGDLYEGEWD